METSTFLRMTEVLRDATLRLATDFKQQAPAHKLRSMDQDASASIERLVENKNTILVVGEVKSGKSSFINAIIGKKLLPVEDDVATGQAIMIRNRTQKEFRLVFTDNATKKISEDELITYASQKAVNENGGIITLGGKELSHIEVDYPAMFLPPNLTLVDTPGAGTLISYHIEITQRFIPEADAVIFVTDAYKPILQNDLNLIEEILHYTPHIFFIQTKIDIIDEWKAVLERNQELLQKHLGNHFKQSPQVWPISNTQLFKASQTGNKIKAERYLTISHFKELEKELKRFLYFVSGLAKTFEVLYALKSYGNDLAAILKGRYNTLSNQSAVEIRQKLNELNQKKKLIKTNWGLEGQGTKEAISQMKSYLSSCKQDFWQLFEKSGKTYTTIAAMIEQIDSLKEGRSLSKRLPEEISRLFMGESDRFFNGIHTKLNQDYQEIARWLSQKVAPYDNDQEEDISDLLEDIFKSPTDALRASLNKNWAQNIKTSVQKSIGTLFLSTVAMAKIVDGIFRSAKRLERVKQDLVNTTCNSLLEMRVKCKEIDPQGDQELSSLEKYFILLMKNWEKRLHQLLQSRKAELDEEIKRLEYQVNSTKDHLEKELQSASNALKSWQVLEGITDQLLLKCNEIIQEMIDKEY
jgi:GTPase Era involved in 16S rRNA processing